MLKPSTYTVVYADEARGGEWVAFNTLTGALAVVDDEVRALLAGDAGASSAGVWPGDTSRQGCLVDEGEVCARLGEEACDALIAAGFLVDAALDEQSELERRFMHDMNESSFLSLCIAPTMACNLRCVYCYEDHESLRMTREVEDAIMHFVERRYVAYRFTLLDVEWYGGEPTLEIDLIERLSGRFQAFCGRHGVTYHASAVTNGTLIDEAVAHRLREAGVAEVMPTLDGLAETHDIRRVTVGGGGSFAQTKAGIRACADAGIYVGANCNLDRASIEGYRALREEYASAPHIDIFASHLRNYGNWCGKDAPECDRSHVIEGAATTKAPGRAKPFASRAAYAQQLFELYAETNPTAASLMASLVPRRSFCRGKMAAYFVIDPEGNVCRCDGFMRDSDHVLFNLLDPSCPIEHPEMRSFFDKNARCAGCVVAPQCLGDCDWEWNMFDENCNALKYTLDRYVLLLKHRLEGEGDTTSEGALPEVVRADAGEDVALASYPAAASRVRLLARSRDVDAFYAAPFTPLSGVVGS